MRTGFNSKLTFLFPLLLLAGILSAQNSAELEEANLLFNAGNYAGALAKTDALIIKDDENAAAWLLSGRIRLKMKDVKGAEIDFAKAVSLDAENGEALLFQGIVYYLNGKYKESVQALDKAAKIIPGDYRVFYNRAESWVELGNLNRAMDDLNQALSINPKKIDALLAKAELNFDLENFKESIADCNKVLEIDSLNADAYFHRGMAVGGESKDKEAVNDFNKAIELNPGHDEALTYRGAAKLLSGNKKGACLDWKRAMELGNDMAEENYEKYCVTE